MKDPAAPANDQNNPAKAAGAPCGLDFIVRPILWGQNSRRFRFRAGSRAVLPRFRKKTPQLCIEGGNLYFLLLQYHKEMIRGNLL